MELKIVGNQFILSGPIVGDEPEKVREALASSPGIETVILRNSGGGNAPAGYRVCEMLREHGFARPCLAIATPPARGCFSAARFGYFTDDYLPQHNNVGFHGIMIRTRIWVPIWCANTVYAIGSSSTATAKPTPFW